MTQVTIVTQETNLFFRQDKPNLTIEPAPAVKHWVNNDICFTPSVMKSQSWEQDIIELEKYFAGVNLPTEPLRLNDCYTINDISKFIDTHLQIIKANNGKKTFISYLEHLKELKSFLLKNGAITV